MSRLEEKLIELGYEEHQYFKKRYVKEKKIEPFSFIYIAIELDKYGVQIIGYSAIDKQSKEEMQKDLEVLRNVED